MRLKTLTAKLVLVLAMAVLATNALATEPATFADALAKAKAENKMLVIDFYTDW